MTGPSDRTSADLIADLEARAPAPLFFLVVRQGDAPALPPPAFLSGGWMLLIDDALIIVEVQPFGTAAEDGYHLRGVALPALSLPTGTVGALFLRNRFLLPHLVRAAPKLLSGCQAVMVQAAARPEGRLDPAEVAGWLSPTGFRPVATGKPAPNGTVHQLFERTPDPRDTSDADHRLVIASDVRIVGGYVAGTLRLREAVVLPCEVTLFADGTPVGIAAARPGEAPDQLTFRIWLAPEFLSTETATLDVALTRFAERAEVRRLPRPSSRRFIPETLLTAPAQDEGKRPIGVLLLGQAQDPILIGVLQGLARQDAQGFTHIRLDGPSDGGRELLRQAATLGFTDLAAHHGRIGPDKLAVQALWHMCQRCRHVVVLNGTVADVPLIRELHADMEGQPQSLDRASPPFHGQFAGNIWSAASVDLQPLVRQLAFLFSLEEADYRRWTCEDGSDGAWAFSWTDALSRLTRQAHAGLDNVALLDSWNVF